MIKNPNKVGQGEPYSYEIENSKQILIITGSHHDELRVIIESFLQANLKIRTRYKCSALHNCTAENLHSRDSYYIVKNIMRQILHTAPFLRDYLLLTSKEDFNQILAEIFDEPMTHSSSLKESQSCEVFVKFIRRINEMKLDFNIVIAITGLEYCFDANNLQNFVYVLRSASVYLNQNSFIKIIATMQHWDEPGPDFLKCTTDYSVNSSRMIAKTQPDAFNEERDEEPLSSRESADD